MIPIVYTVIGCCYLCTTVKYLKIIALPTNFLFLNFFLMNLEIFPQNEHISTSSVCDQKEREKKVISDKIAYFDVFIWYVKVVHILYSR